MSSEEKEERESINNEKEQKESENQRGKRPNQERNAKSSDSDTDDEKPSPPKTLEDLGIKLDQSNHIWRSQKDLNARQLGFISPVLFTRNVAGSVNMIRKFKLERKLDFHTGCVNTLNFNCSGDLLASGSDDLDVVVWDWAKGKKLFSYESGHSGNVFQVSRFAEIFVS